MPSNGAAFSRAAVIWPPERDPFSFQAASPALPDWSWKHWDFALAVGSGCTVLMPNGNRVEAEVVGFHGDRLYLMPTNDVFGLSPGAKVIPWDHAGAFACTWRRPPAAPPRLRPG